ncbi:class I adenylate-forming enzyme family protein [Bradyrhizobium cenepequi]|uniref:class I adenylate-forming enzyme family protein n=1 Tax=Bradyrhizobium cenepequi TaxID=2821403 RepID=UPI001CE2D37A|nr:class I adenylate-forming enzyme family protein [Bradyrhizobium cenepequi]MCA6110881.1 acyl--CoA ligase [Bradyrhizobium cenepequi]
MQKAQARPKSTAFIFHGEAWTYERISTESGALARGMAARGVKPGDRVALHMMNRPEFIIAYYACFRLGAIASPLRTAFTFTELGALLHRLKPALYIGETKLYDNVVAVDGAILPRDKRFIVDPFLGCDALPWEKLLESTDNNSLSEPDAATVLINTSGTTGEPKFVIHTPITLGESVNVSIKNAGLSSEDVVAIPLALAHMAGLTFLLCLMQLGAVFVLLESFDADEVLDTIERHRCTWHFGFPAQYAVLLDRQRVRPRNLETLRLCLTAGDVSPIDLQQRITAEFDAPLYNVWASTETAVHLAYGLRVGPVARIVKETEVRLVDHNDADVANGEIGELLLRGANLFVGYWNDPQATSESLKGGWFHTGDLMQRGEGDELLFVGRKKDIIIRGGTNISPVEVEQALVAAHPAVVEAAVVGMPDATHGQRVIGFVKLAQGVEEASVNLEIFNNVATRLAAYKVPEHLFVVDKLPRNTMGKVDRKLLQTMAAHQSE